VRPLSSAAGRRLASETIASFPDASLREVARVAGISPATVRDVRERMARGDDPVPSGHRRTGDPPTAPRTPSAESASLPRDRAVLLEHLSRDPSLRLNETGRQLLRWLFTQANAPDGGEALIRDLPPHCGYLVAEIARGCASAWQSLAERLEQRFDKSA
jgi:hypothetical protein